MASEEKSAPGEGLVQCAVCKKLIPPSEAVSPEGHEYVLWFCGGECHAHWERERERAAEAEAAFGRRSGVPEDWPRAEAASNK